MNNILDRLADSIIAITMIIALFFAILFVVFVLMSYPWTIVVLFVLALSWAIYRIRYSGKYQDPPPPDYSFRD